MDVADPSRPCAPSELTAKGVYAYLSGTTPPIEVLAAVLPPPTCTTYHTPTEIVVSETEYGRGGSIATLCAIRTDREGVENVFSTDFWPFWRCFGPEVVGVFRPVRVFLRNPVWGVALGPYGPGPSGWIGSIVPGRIISYY